MTDEVEQKAAPAWRTVATAASVAAMQLAGFVYLVHHGATVEGATAYGAFCLWSTTAAVGQAAKSTVESLAKGSGVRGAVSALMTDAKPGEESK